MDQHVSPRLSIDLRDILVTWVPGLLCCKVSVCEEVVLEMVEVSEVCEDDLDYHRDPCILCQQEDLCNCHWHDYGDWKKDDDF